MARREALLHVSAKYVSKTFTWTVSARQGKLTARAKGAEFKSTYKAALAALKLMKSMNEEAKKAHAHSA